MSWVATLFWLGVVRIKRCGGSGFGGGAVLMGSSGDQVSFNTTVGVRYKPSDRSDRLMNYTHRLKSCCISS